MFPEIRRKVKKIINNSLEKNYIIIDAAVLFDSKLDLLCDYIILVKADKSLRKKLLKDKGTEISDEDIDLRLEGQHIKINKNLVNFTVINNGSKADLYKKVEDILEEINEYQI
jgi:dephospho-CoA kinase